ncbi:MAG TPA: ComEC/Rec2 family competence protein, partial [Thermoanaerobaculia bacterium]|nr:ComEC/Rec2 family competence protein [Thermoanaerobaculia bacterium]
MIGAVARSGRAPAAWAASLLVAGTLFGAWSVTGRREAALLALLGGAIACSGAQRLSRIARIGFVAFWLSLGFLSGISRVAIPAQQARETFWRLPAGRDRSDRVEGVITDFWVGQPPRAHGRLRAERLWIDGQWHRFPAEVLLFVSGDESLTRVADRGDRVVAVGNLVAEGPAVSERDLRVPWPVYRLSVKSGMRIERQRATWLSRLTLPNRRLFEKLPAPGSRGAEFDRDVRGPLAALLLGRTSEVDRGMVARYRRGGLYHLLVVSGLHVALAAGLL